MPKPRKVIVYRATSADGYIARSNGRAEWLNRRPHKYDYGMKQFYASIDTTLLGRKTYDRTVYYCEKIGKPPEFDAKVPHRLLAQAAAKSGPRSRVRDESRQGVHSEAASAARQAHLS